MTWIPKPQEIYKHFKGKLYQIITLAEHSESGEMMVVYQALYGDYKMYVRPLEMFVSKVDKEKYPEVKQEYRFALQNVTPADSVSKSSMIETAEPKALQSEPVTEVHTESEPRIEESPLDPLVWEFLDADTHEKRLNILAALHHRITDSMITTMALACDVEVPEGDIETRYSQLKNCLVTLDRFEIQRKR